MKLFRHFIDYLKSNSQYGKWRYLPIIRFFHAHLFKRIHRVLDTEYKFFESILSSKDDALIFDIGASVGNTSQHFLRLGNRVIAVEPEFENYQIISNRYKSNSKITTIRQVVSNQSGNLKLFIERGNSLHTVNVKWKNIAPKRSNRQIIYDHVQNVQATTLNALIQTHGLPELIKVDVEGNEYNVISPLSYPVPLIIFEANLPEFLDETLQLIKVLVDYKFEVYELGETDFVLLGNETCLQGLGRRSVDILARRKSELISS